MINCEQKPGDERWETLKFNIDRMAGLEKFPKPEFEPAAYRELVLALQCCNSLAEAENTISDIVLCESVCPTPASLRRLIYSNQEKSTVTPAIKEIQGWYAQNRHLPPKDRDELNTHIDLMQARFDELTKNPTLNRFGPDGRRPMTPTLAKLQEASRKLIAI